MTEATRCSVCDCRWPVLLNANTSSATMSFVYYGHTCSKKCARIARLIDLGSWEIDLGQEIIEAIRELKSRPGGAL